jgi:hypothetical protein
LDPGAADPYGNYTLANLYTFLNGYTLTRDPGAQFEYSNAGVALLGDALANAKRTNYGQLLQDRVLTPLDMHETAIALQPQRRDRLAAGHDADGNPVPLWTFKAGAPAGAIISSLSDMLKYLRANMLQGPLSKVCLFAQQPRDSIPSAQIGLIWWTNDFTSIINHGGDTNGYHAWIAISPDHLHGVVVLTNGGGPVEDLALHAIDPDLPATVASRDAQLDAAALDGYVGVYNGAQAQTLTISHVGDHLVAQLSDQPAARLYPASKDHFYYRMVPARIDFIRDSQGKAYALVMREQGEALVFTRPGLRTPPPSALAPSYPPVIALDSQTLDEYAGDYFGATTTLHFTVTREGNSLFVQLDDQPAYQVFPASQDHFYYKIVDAQIDFQRDAQGRVNALVLHQNGYDITSLKRVPASPLPVK